MYNKEEQLRDQICDIGKRIYMKDMVAANDGNVSAKLTEGVFICTPTGVSKGFMKPDMLCKINEKGELIEENKYGLTPSSEMKMHLKIYEKRKDVNSVVHAHPQHATAYAICNIPLDKQIMPEATISLGIVPIAKYGAPSTNELSESLLPFLEEYDAVLLANHGAVTYGKDVTAAYYKMESLEFYAKLLYLSNNIGKPIEFSYERVEQLLDLKDNYYKPAGKHPGAKCLINLQANFKK
ncbi:MAG: class II aldolase/adducin family protein [Clostridium sp.]